MSDEELLKRAEKDLAFLLKIELPEPSVIANRSIAASQLGIARNSVQAKQNIDVKPPKYYPPSVKVV